MERLKTRTSRLRQLEELLLLKPGGLRAADLARTLKVNRRTVYRDLDFLAEQGVPLWQENGIFGINRTRYQTTVRLTYHESVALVLAGLLLARTFDERNPHVIAALRRLAVTLPEPFTAQLERAALRTQANNTNPRHTAVLEALAEGWGTGRKVQITYCSPKGNTLHERVIAPYTLEPTDAGIYVIGHDEASGEIRTFKLERLQTARILSEPYVIPDDFDAEAHLAHSWRVMTGDEPVEVLLKFSPDAAPYVRERTWHPSQRIGPYSSGGVDGEPEFAGSPPHRDPSHEDGVLLCLGIAEPREMLPWIRSWGAQVEVLAPDWLRERVANELTQAAMQYGTRINANEHG
ncbi:MAG TPA: WYL domain-containing transcriptional regulator [Anaerolineales bacterium]|nr:WYL domain-containing transcriptional regulator [Anaerolineales bacterium]